MNQEPTTSLEGHLLICFVATWFLVVVCGVFLIYEGEDVAFKRKWFPWYVILAGVLFVAFTTVLWVLSTPFSESLLILLFMVPAVALTSYLNIKFTKFCDGCAKPIHRLNWFAPRKFCSSCGAKLDTIPKKSENFLG